MRRSSTLHAGAVLLALLGARPLQAAGTASPADTARLLAGLPVAAGSPLAAAAASPAAKAHAQRFDAAFGRVERTQIERIRRWSGANIVEHDATLFYFFSGPDFLYADAFFPDADTYVLAGLEPPGPVPDVAALPKGTLPTVLRSLETSLRSILGLSFFQTKEMSAELGASRAVSGTIPLLYIFMARAGKEVEEAVPVRLDADGEVSTENKGNGARGVRITFSAPGGTRRTLYYFGADVAGGGFKTSGLEAFCDKLGRGDALVKSASYLLHGSNFAGVRAFILKHADRILQDDTGVPVALFDRSWQLRPYGHYVGPIGLFAGNYQPKLTALYRHAKVGPIDFGIGYKYNASQSTLLLAVKEQPAPAKAPAPRPEAAKPETPKAEMPKAETPKAQAPLADPRTEAAAPTPVPAAQPAPKPDAPAPPPPR